MQLKKINSKNILAVGYDAALPLPGVKFRIFKRVYGFLHVPQQVYEAFMKSKSQRSYFNEYMKNNYPFIEIQ